MFPSYGNKQQNRLQRSMSARYGGAGPSTSNYAGTNQESPMYRGTHSQARSYRSDTPQKESSPGTRTPPPAYQSSDSDSEEAQAPPLPNKKLVRMFDVKMPTGITVKVTVPAKRCSCRGKCNFDFRAITLNPDGEMGRREFNIVAGEMQRTIRYHSKSAGGRFTCYDIISIEKIQNCCLWKRFRKQEGDIHRQNGYCVEKMLFHGSNATDQIIKYGFNKNCAKPGGMFGQAIYFAQHSSKSNQYVYGYLNGKGCAEHQNKSCYQCERKLVLCRVALGRSTGQTSVNKMASAPQGYHSVRGVPSRGGLRYPEYAIHDPAQAYPEYLITYRIAKGNK